MIRSRLRAVAARMAVLTVAAALLAHAGPARAADVHGDDERDAYVGTGGLILPASVEASTRDEIASCGGCQWRLATPCLVSPAGHPFDGQSTCMSVVRGCPAARRLLRTWFRDPEGRWRDIGLVCLEAGGPTTVADVGRRVQDRVLRGIPALQPTFQPHRGVVTQLPVIFDSGQPGGPQEWELSVQGEPVRLVATPSWTWEFGDDASLRTADPGGTYPHAAVEHAYRRAGGQRVTVTTRWLATFTVDGLGPFPVPEPVSQQQVVDLAVGEGRALLTPA